jgi:hypothetical protein
MNRLLVRFNRWRFNRVAQGVLATPPVVRGEAPFAGLSMVHHRDVVPYLLAIKSFCLHARPARVFVVADPSLDETDRRVLLAHVPFAEIVDAVGFQRPALPKGGTWERLSAISQLCAEVPIVQLDADTLTFGRPTEVIEGLAAGASFIVRSEAGVEIVDLDAAAAEGQRRSAASSHVQVATESRLPALRPAAGFRYARGCSGFTGFGRGAISPALLADVSGQLRAVLGPRWDEWGTEQVTSNLLAASAPAAFMLPHPRYCNADSAIAQTVVAHYIGYCRHVNRNYETRAVAVLKALNAAA